MALSNEILTVNNAFNNAIDRGDVATAVAQFTTDCICTAPDMPIIKGHLELADCFQSWIDAGFKNPKDSDHFVESEGDIAYMTCSFSGEYHTDDGGVTKEEGKSLQVFKRNENGNWKVHRFGISIDFDE